MSYLGFTKILTRDFLTNFKRPSVLEIGLDDGQTTLPLIHNMSVMFDEFDYTGIDVKFKMKLFEQLSQFSKINLINARDEKQKNSVTIYETNSLDWLYLNKESKNKYDLVLIDGDHNYYTVYNELKMLEPLVHNNTLIVCDDYNGRYSNKDLFYIERNTHKDNKYLHKPVKLEREGVSTAIDDYANNATDKINVSVFGNLDPCFIYKSDYLDFTTTNHDNTKIRDMKINFKFK